jgi:EmrB/QacA subfamily drug resistance transporter
MTVPVNPVTATRALARRNSNGLLVLVCLAQYMVILDVSIVNVALPAIHDDLGFSSTGLQWVVNAYTLTFAGFLMLGGRAADLLGRRRVFLGGTALFVLASLTCAAAGSQAVMLGARALQGLGAAIISPASLSIIATSFGEGRDRNRALGVWGAMAGLGGSSGVLLGGALTQGVGWQAIFLINVPIGLTVLFLGPRIIPEGRREEVGKHFDAAGAILVTAGLTALVYGIVRTDTLSWGSPGVVVPIAVAAVLLALFVLVEGRLSPAPLVPLKIFRMPRLRSANLVIVLLYSGFFAMWFFLSLYLQQVHHEGALETGVSFLPMTLAIVLASSVAPRLVARFGVRNVMSTGMLFVTAGLALFSALDPASSYWTLFLPAGLLAAVGLGFSLVPATIAAVQGVPPTQSGLASALVNTSRLFGGALGLAVLSTLATSRTHSKLADGVGTLQAATDGYQVAFAVGAALCLLGAIAAVTLMGRRVEPSIAFAEERAT